MDCLDKPVRDIDGILMHNGMPLKKILNEKLSLVGADLTGANLTGENLKGAKIDYQIQEGLLEQVAEAALSSSESLDMDYCHDCDTTHCIAGLACHLNPVAKELEKTHGTEVAALLTLGAEAHKHFHKIDREAIIYLKSVLESKA